MEGLDFGNILGGNEIDSLFVEDEKPVEETTGEKSQEETTEIDNNDTKQTTETVSPNGLFEGDMEEQPESVGSVENNKEQGDTTTEKDGGTSPNENLYSSIAQACEVDGIFPNLDHEIISKADSAESFSDLIEAEVNARLDEKQRRISKALENGVEPDDIRKYENVLHNISNITEAQLSAESDAGEQLRQNIIYQDFLNKGYSPEKAQKFTQRTIDAGTDIEDAKEALQSNKEYFQNQYNALLKQAQDEADKSKAERQKQAEKLRKSLMEDKTIMGDLEITNDIRRKAFDNVSKPIYRDPETGEYLTALQKYEMENRADFLKYTSLIFSLTNGFKDFDSFTKGKVKKEVRKGLRELEQTLANTRRNPDGSLKLVTKPTDDPESLFNGNFKLAL
jgi:hypothetical protein